MKPDKMELLVRLFPYGKTIAGMRNAFDQGQLLKDSTAARARRSVVDTRPSWSLFQTQAAHTMLQNREAAVMPRMALMLGLMGIGMSGYSTRQLTLHYKPCSNLFR